MSDNPPAGGDLSALTERCEAISAYSSWSGQGDNVEGDLQDIRNAIHELRDCFASYLRARATLKSEEKL